MLSMGTKLGPYEIVSPVGAGGMGEVEPFWRRERAAQPRTGATRRNPEPRMPSGAWAAGEGSLC
jgi:hypothetical protein